MKTLLRSMSTVRLALLAPFVLIASVGVAVDYQDEWGPAVGSTMPAIDASDHTGTPRALGDLAGERGLLLFVSRSADW